MGKLANRPKIGKKGTKSRKKCQWKLLQKFCFLEHLLIGPSVPQISNSGKSKWFRNYYRIVLSRIKIRGEKSISQSDGSLVNLTSGVRQNM